MSIYGGSDVKTEHVQELRSRQLGHFCSRELCTHVHISAVLYTSLVIFMVQPGLLQMYELTTPVQPALLVNLCNQNDVMIYMLTCASLYLIH